MRLQDLVKDFFASHNYLLIRYSAGHRRRWLQEVGAIKKDRTLLLDYGEACQLIAAVRAVEKIPGDLAELGVAYGASAKLIRQAAQHRRLHLFDTFEGLPSVDARKDNAKFSEGDFRGDLADVRDYVGNGQVHYWKGHFPASASAAKDRTFAFVHLDVDLYQSTLDGLAFFFPRMARGGIIISHDYLSAEGVNLAFKEFFQEKREPVIELSGYQCMVVKTSD